MSRRITQYLDLAIEIAKASPNTKHIHASVLVKGKRILAVGMNTERPISPHSHYTRHAEQDVFRNYRHRLIRAELFLARLTPGRVVSTSEPCETCGPWLLENTKVKRVYFTTEPDAFDWLDLASMRRNN